MGLFDSPIKRTPAEWKERLTQENTPITLEEYVAGILIRMAGSVFETSQASQHLEGMLGAIDESFSRHDPAYAGSAVVRNALHERRRAVSSSPGSSPLDIDALIAALGARVPDQASPGQRSLGIPAAADEAGRA